MKKFNLLVVSIFLFFSTFGLGFINSADLTIWYKGDDADKKIFNPIVKDFENRYNVKVNVIYNDVNKITADVVDSFKNNPKNLPHIVYTANDLAGFFAANNYILPIDDFMSSFLRRKFGNEELHYGYYKGKDYLISDLVGNNVVLFYNKNLVTKPTGYNDLLKQATNFMQKNKGQFGLVYPNYAAYYLMGFFNASSNVFLRERIRIEGDAMVEALEIAKELSALGRVGITKQQSVDLFAQGRVPFLMATTDVVATLNEKGLFYEIMPVPMPKNRQSRFYTSSIGFMMTNTQETKDKEKLIKTFFSFYFDNKRYKETTLARESVPVTIPVYKDKDVNLDKTISMVKTSLYESTAPMPIVPKMRAVWDGIIPVLKDYLDGKIKSASAASRIMQENAIRLSKEYGFED